MFALRISILSSGHEPLLFVLLDETFKVELILEGTPLQLIDVLGDLLAHVVINVAVRGRVRLAHGFLLLIESSLHFSDKCYLFVLYLDYFAFCFNIFLFPI